MKKLKSPKIARMWCEKSNEKAGKGVRRRENTVKKIEKREKTQRKSEKQGGRG